MEQEFAQRFAEIWQHPSPEQLVALLHSEVVLYQPQMPPIHGRQAALEEFQRLFRWLPDTYGEVERFCGANGVLFIEWQMKLPIGKNGLSLKAVDRFILQEGLGIERAVYFNQLPLMVDDHPR
jgi:hypothetical protein